jgi:NTE family protein
MFLTAPSEPVIWLEERVGSACNGSAKRGWRREFPSSRRGAAKRGRHDTGGPSMSANRPANRNIHLLANRPPFERIALLLQGGGALGAYQGGVYQALAEADLHPDWVAGVSIGAINAALIAGNPPDKRVGRLRQFWEAVSAPRLGIPDLGGFEFEGALAHSLANRASSWAALVAGAPHFFTPRVPPPFLYPDGRPEALSYYDTAPLRTTLERLVDFDLINARAMRFSVGAVHLRTGDLVYFDNATHQIRAEHVIASGSLPPGFPPTPVDGEDYWDGGLVSNTPLQWVLDQQPRRDTLAFQIDLWNARGELPRNLFEVDTRQKEIRYASRTRTATEQFKERHLLRRAAARLLAEMPPHLTQSPEAERLAAAADDTVYNVVQLIYRSKRYEGACKDYEFSRRSMEEHWRAGYKDAVHSLEHPEIFERPEEAGGVSIFDLGNGGRD